MVLSQLQIEKVVQHYCLGTLFSYSSVGSGLHSFVFRTETSKGVYAIKVYKYKQKEQLLYESVLLNLLAGQLPVPQLVIDKNNECVFILNSHCVVVYPFFEGTSPISVTNEMITEIGSFLGRYHTLVYNKTIIGKRNDLSLVGLQQVLAKNKKLIMERALDADKYIPKIEQYFSGFSFPITLPFGPIHLDIKPDNTLFSGNILVGVVDFDNSFVGPLLLDVCKSVMWWCALDEGRVNIAKLKLLLSAYQKQRAFTSEEKKCFYQMLQFAFISHAVWDLYLNACDKKTPDWYLQQVVFPLFAIGEKMRISEEQIKQILQ